MDVSAYPARGQASPEDMVIRLASERVPPSYGASEVRRPTVDLGLGASPCPEGPILSPPWLESA